MYFYSTVLFRERTTWRKCMGRQKNIYLQKIRDYLSANGKFPEQVEISQKTGLADGSKVFRISARWMSETYHLAVVNLSDVGVTMMNDYRDGISNYDEILATQHLTPEEIKQRSQLPLIFELVRTELSKQFRSVNIRDSEFERPIPTVAAMEILDNSGFTHKVTLSIVQTENEMSRIRKDLGEVGPLDTIIVIYTQPNKVAGKIISMIKYWTKHNWPSPK